MVAIIAAWGVAVGPILLAKPPQVREQGTDPI